MLFTTVLLTLLSATGISARQPGRNIVWYHAENKPVGGFDSISAKYYIDPASTRIRGYYSATQWGFEGHDVQYFGIQPQTPGTRNTTGHLAYSVFGKGSSIGDPARCSMSADGGPGVSCWLDIDIEFGRWYTIESKVVEKTADGSRRWNGTLVDDSTGKRTYIASFWTDASYGGLGTTASQWMEWWPWNVDGLTEATRPCQKWYKTTFQRPIGNGVQVPIAKPQPDTIDDKCATLAGKPNFHSEFDSNGYFVCTAGILTAQYDH